MGLAGNRGGGKTQVMLMDALSGVGRGWGSNYKMILFRRSQREFTDILNWLVPLIKNHLAEVPVQPTEKYFRVADAGEAGAFLLRQRSRLAAVSGQKLSRASCGKNLTLWPDPRNVSVHVLLSAVPSPRRSCRARSASPLTRAAPVTIGSRTASSCSGIPDRNLWARASPKWARTAHVEPPHDLCQLRRQRAPKTDRAFLHAGRRAVVRRRSGATSSVAFGDWSIVAGGGFDSIFFEHGKNIFVEFELPASGKLLMTYDHGARSPTPAYFGGRATAANSVRDGRSATPDRDDLFLVGEVYGCHRPTERGH